MTAESLQLHQAARNAENYAAMQSRIAAARRDRALREWARLLIVAALAGAAGILLGMATTTAEALPALLLQAEAMRGM